MSGTQALAACHCGLLRDTPCTATATAEDLLCGECRTWQQPASMIHYAGGCGTQRRHYTSALTDAHLTGYQWRALPTVTGHQDSITA